MPITLSQGRQYKLIADLPITFTDLAGLSGAAQDAVKLPSGAVVHDVRVVTDTAFNSATSDTLSVGDAASATRYINANATVLRTAGLTQDAAAASKGFKYTASAGGVVRVTWTGVGAVPTAGAFRLYVEYSVDNKALEVQT
jgi:hypothetical protein